MTTAGSSLSDWGVAQWLVFAYVVVGLAVFLAIRCYLRPVSKRGPDGSFQWTFRRGDLLGRLLDMLDVYPVPFSLFSFFFGLFGLSLSLCLASSNQTMKPTRPLQENLSEFVTTPSRGLSLSR
jgi:hypothetical protein